MRWTGGWGPWSQQWEDIYLFQGDGQGSFGRSIIFGSSNDDFGSSGIFKCDLNRDGRPDILYSNGDGFDHAAPGPRPWHGVQWLENRGNGFFKYHRIADMPGAFSPKEIDFDGDGDADILAVSNSNNWSSSEAVSLMLFRNDGTLNFRRETLAKSPTHLLSLAVGDFDSSSPGLEFVTGGFHAYPPYDRMSRLSLWRTEQSP